MQNALSYYQEKGILDREQPGFLSIQKYLAAGEKSIWKIFNTFKF